MTLILVAANSDYVVQLSDRRLTVEGRLHDDETNKAVIVIGRDGRLAAGYTGIGEYRSFHGHEFIAEVAMKAAPPDFSVAGILRRFPGVATNVFNSNPDIRGVDASRRHLTISLFGYAPDARHGPTTLGGVLVTNGFGDSPGPAKDHFAIGRIQRLRNDAVPGEVTFIDAIGASDMVSEAEVSALRQLLREHRPPEAVVGKGVEMLRTWAGRPEAQGAIGSQISSIILPAATREDWVFDYHTSIPRGTKSYPITVDASGRAGPVAFQFEIRQEEGVFAVPKVGRNEPCPCGAGQKYKRCHGLNPSGSPGRLT